MSTLFHALDPSLPVDVGVTLRAYQEAAITKVGGIIDAPGKHRHILCLPTGGGKCLAPGTSVQLFDPRTRDQAGWNGSVAVETIVPGMRLMGPDSQPRNVGSTTKGFGEIVEIRPLKGPPWRANLDHVLTLVHTSSGDVVDIPIREWERKSPTWRREHKLFRASVELRSRQVPIDPYLVGLLLGDGCLTGTSVSIANPDAEVIAACRSAAAEWGLTLVDVTSGDRCPHWLFSTGRNSGRSNPLIAACRSIGIWGRGAAEKAVPTAYREGSIDQRLAMLAGVLDTDGHYTGRAFDFVTASNVLANDVVYMAWSVGLGASIRAVERRVPGTTRTATYDRVTISGDLDRIPTRVARKRAKPRRSPKDVNRFGFTLERVGYGPYYGFTLDGDGRFLLADCTVTHNTECAIYLADLMVRADERVMFCADRLTLVDQTVKRFRGAGYRVGVMQADQEGDAFAPIQIASAQTLEARTPTGSNPFAPYGMVIVDEAHDQRAKMAEWIRGVEYPSVAVGLSATPLRPGLGRVWDGVTTGATTRSLFESGHLIEPIIECAQREANRDEGKKQNGEYTARSSAEQHTTLTGDIVESYRRRCRFHFGTDKVPTVVYASTVDHGADLIEAFGRVGVKLRQVSYKSTRDERRNAIAAADAGTIDGLVSVDALTKGFDWPAARVMVIARMLDSGLITHLQMLGRIIRPHPPSGKTKCVIRDHAGNCWHFAADVEDFWNHGVDVLPADEPKRRKKRDRPERRELVCRCGRLLKPADRECPACGYERTRKQQVRHRAGELDRLDMAAVAREDPLPDIVSMARERFARWGDAERCRNWVLSNYKEVTGNWPRRSFDVTARPGRVRPSVRAAVRRSVEASHRERVRDDAMSVARAIGID